MLQPNFPTPVNDPALLNLMLDDEAKQSPLYRPGPYWAPYQRRTIEAIRRHGIDRFRAQADICKGFADAGMFWPPDLWWGWKGSVRRAVSTLPLVRDIIADYRAMGENTEAHLRMMQGAWFARVLAEIDLPDTVGAGAADLVPVNGQRLSRQYLLSFLRTTNVARVLRFDRLRAAMEIGGGFGFWPHLMLHRYHGLRKIVYLDIPPMIYLATQYLKMFFPVRDYRETRALSDIRFRDDDSIEVICLCPWQIEAFHSPIDLLWNISSFSEMTPAIVENYGRHIAPLHPKAICVMLNKSSADRGTSPREAVLQALGGGFVPLEPAVPHPFDAPLFYSLRDPSLDASRP